MVGTVTKDDNRLYDYELKLSSLPYQNNQLNIPLHVRRYRHSDNRHDVRSAKRGTDRQRGGVNKLHIHVCRSAATDPNPDHT
jgi:hypothetical protein